MYIYIYILYLSLLLFLFVQFCCIVLLSSDQANKDMFYMFYIVQKDLNDVMFELRPFVGAPRVKSPRTNGWTQKRNFVKLIYVDKRSLSPPILIKSLSASLTLNFKVRYSEIH